MRFLASRIRREVTGTLFALLLLLIGQLLLSVLVARVLGPAGKGTLALVTLLPAFCVFVFHLGLGTAFVVLRGRGSPSGALLALGGFRMLLATAVAALLLATGAARWVPRAFPGVDLVLLVVAFLAFPADLLTGDLLALLQAERRIGAANLLRLGTLAAYLLGTVVLLALGAGVFSLVVLGVFVSMGSAVAGIFALRVPPDFAGARAVAPDAARLALRAHIAILLQSLTYRLPYLFVNASLGAEAVGIFSVAISMSEALWLLPDATAFVLFPHAANEAAEERRRDLPRHFRRVIAPVILGATALTILGRPLLSLLYGAPFAAAYPCLLALLPGAVSLAAVKILHPEFAARGRVDLPAVGSALGFVTLLFAYGAGGGRNLVAAGGSVSLAYLATFAFALWTLPRATGVRPVRLLRD